MSVQPSDKASALAGLIVGACIIYLFVFGMVQFTNAKYAKHKEVAAESTK